MPRLCRPYRAKTKGKVERFNRYLRYSFYIPFQSRLSQVSLSLDVYTANAEVGKRLAEVANCRIHREIGVRPDQRLEIAQPLLLPLHQRATVRHTREESVAKELWPIIPLQRSPLDYEHYFQRIALLFEQLKCSAILENYPNLADTAARKEASYVDYLEELLKAENELRQSRSRNTLAKMAGFPAIKTLEDYDFNFATGAPRQRLLDLSRSGSWGGGHWCLIGLQTTRYHPCNCFPLDLLTGMRAQGKFGIGLKDETAGGTLHSYGCHTACLIKSREG